MLGDPEPEPVLIGLIISGVLLLIFVFGFFFYVATSAWVQYDIDHGCWETGRTKEEHTWRLLAGKVIVPTTITYREWICDGDVASWR